MKKFLLGLLTSMVFLTGCGGENKEISAPTNKISVRIAQDPDFLDPHKFVAASTGEILFNTFEGLMKPDDKGNLYPALASDYTMSEDGLTYTFTIKKDVFFHNGTELTPELVKLSYERFLNEGFPANRSTNEFRKTLKEIKIDGDKISFTLNSLNGSGASAFMDGIVYEENDKLYGTGPYTIDSYLPGEKITFKKFDKYWDISNVGNIEEVDFKIIKDSQGAILSFQTGEVDILPRMLVGHVEMVENFGNIVEDKQNLVQLLALNNNIEPLNDIKVRQAIHYAIDKNEIIEGASLGRGSIVGSGSSPLVANIYNKETENLYNTNLDKARELLKEAGYPKGFEVELKAPSNFQNHVDAAQIVKEQLAKVGIIVNISEIEWGTWLSEVYANRNYQMTVIGFEGEASPYRVFDRYMTNESRNMVNFNNKEYDDIILKAKLELDENKRQELFKKAQYILTEKVASVFLQSPNYIVAINKNINGFKIYPLYILDIGSLTIKESIK